MIALLQATSDAPVAIGFSDAMFLVCALLFVGGSIWAKYGRVSTW